MTRTLAEVGACFRDRRKYLTLTQQQVVELAEAHFGHKVVGESTYRQFEAGRSDGISDRTARGAAVALRWPLDAVERLRAGEDPADLPDVNYSESADAPPWEELLAGQRQVSETVERLADLFEERFPE